ncbi:MAG TPA: translation initiation factor IF-2 [Syntrophomonas sp.]|nr:translation initiation factor IF-2 [Syntrophomonas sp.]
MAKVRVHEIAKDLGMTSKDMVDALLNMGLDVKNHMSTLEESQANWVKKQLGEKSPGKGEKVVKRDSAGVPERKTPETGVKSRQLPRPASQPASKTERPVKGEPARTERPVAGDGRIPGKPVVKTQGDDRRPLGRAEKDRRASDKARQERRPSERTMQQPGNRALDSAQRDQGRFKNNDRQVVERQQKQGPQGEKRVEGGKRPPAPTQHRSPQQRPPQQRPPQQRQEQPKGDNKSLPADKRNTDTVKGKDNRNAQPAKPGKYDKSKGPKKPGSAVIHRDYSRPGRKQRHKRKKEEVMVQLPDQISIEDSITVRDLAEKLHRGSAEIVKKLMELGIMAVINQSIDFETAEIVASLYEVKVERVISEEEKLLEEIYDEEASLKLRPPVVTVMGHVDHGKTSLLDRIRKADVVSGEAGGITQHIGAYQVTVNDSRVTFIDTPGHEAFTAMRARGANLTDIVVLVVAADDGVMPQTIEAINHIKAADVPFVVAVNKIDKPEANPDRVMQQLTEYGIVAEEWGGDTIFVPVSAKRGDGIENLLEMILLVAEMHEIKANPDRLAEGVVIEGQLDRGRGPVGTVLVLKGTLKIGECLICGNNFCKVRAMTDHKGRRVEQAFPSMPVEITGWSEVPEAGGRVLACDEKVAKEVVNLRLSEKKIEEQKQSSKVSLDDFFKQMQDANVKELNLIIKGDVQGSIEALAQSLLRLATDEVKVSVIHSAVGAISETDVMLASASQAIIIGFNVRPDVKARKYAEDEGIDVRLYRVIYEANEDVKKAMAGLLDPEYREKYLGRAEVRATFKVPNVGMIAGSYVIDGKIQRNASMRVLRDGVIVYEGRLASLKRFKDDVREVVENYECGIGIQDFNDIKEGDIIEAYTLEEIPREL